MFQQLTEKCSNLNWNVLLSQQLYKIIGLNNSNLLLTSISYKINDFIFSYRQLSNTYIFVFKICRVVICIYSPDHTTRLMHLKRCLAKAFLLMASVVRLKCQYLYTYAVPLSLQCLQFCLCIPMGKTGVAIFSCSGGVVLSVHHTVSHTHRVLQQPGILPITVKWVAPSLPFYCKMPHEFSMHSQVLLWTLGNNLEAFCYL